MVDTHIYPSGMILGLFEGWKKNFDNLFDDLWYKFFQLDPMSSITLYVIFSNPNLGLIIACEPTHSMINKIPKFSRHLHVVEETIASYPLYYEEFIFQQRMCQLFLSYFEDRFGHWPEQN